MAFTDRAWSLAGLLLGRLNRRVAFVERWLQTPLTAEDEQALRSACSAIGWRFGAFYQWYLLKLLISRRVRQLGPESIWRMIHRADQSDYQALDAALADERGLLIAIPHHGHYILSITALAHRLCVDRAVMVFYGDPKTHPGNELFDALHLKLWEDSSSRLQVIHNTRAGLAKAIRGLQQGAVVIIMPDVYQDESETYQLPFCGRPLSVMLGTAALARKTGAGVLPMIARAESTGIRFANLAGPLLRSGDIDAGAGSKGAMMADYRMTSAMFQFYESVMAPEILHWQYVRQHQRRIGRFPCLATDSIPELAELVLSESTVALRIDSLVNLDLPRI